MRTRGFTLLELTFATLLLAVGVLAVAATAVPLARLVRRADALAASAAAAGAAVETARASGCAAADAGQVALHGLHLSWEVTGSGAPRAMTVVTTYPWGPGVHSDTFQAAVACGR